jgi:putative oxidoreductase
VGLAAWMVAPTILVELGGGILLVLGAWTRIVALVLAAFCVATAFIVHFHPGDQGQMINFMKNLAMTGGFLFVFLHGGGKVSFDEKFRLPWRG